jgi:hypothetical protein
MCRSVVECCHRKARFSAGGFMFRSSLILLVAFAFCASSSLYGGVLLNENFDELTPQEGATMVGAFTAINGTDVDIVANGGIFGYLCQPPESGNCIDMDGGYAWGNPQGQLQSNMLFPAGKYLLSFDLIGSQRGITASTTVTFGNYDQTFVLTSTDDITGIVVNEPVTLSAPGYLLFASNTPGQIGTLLDNVVVTDTPEPCSVILFGSGLVAAASAVRRRVTR